MVTSVRTMCSNPWILPSEVGEEVKRSNFCQNYVLQPLDIVTRRGVKRGNFCQNYVLQPLDIATRRRGVGGGGGGGVKVGNFCQNYVLQYLNIRNPCAPITAL